MVLQTVDVSCQISLMIALTYGTLRFSIYAETTWFPVTPIVHQRSCSDRFPQAMQLLLTIADCHVTSEYKLDIGHTEVRYSTGNHNFPIVSMSLSTLAAIFRLWFCHPRFELQQLHVYHHGIFYWTQTWLKCFEKQVQAHKRTHTFSHYEASFDVFNTSPL